MNAWAVTQCFKIKAFSLLDLIDEVAFSHKSQDYILSSLGIIASCVVWW